MKVSYANPQGTYIRIEHNDGQVETNHVTDQGNPIMDEIRAMQARGELRIAPFKPLQKPTAAKQVTRRAKRN